MKTIFTENWLFYLVKYLTSNAGALEKVVAFFVHKSTKFGKAILSITLDFIATVWD